ncbi:X-domain of DnaJ-containing-domain-containing protein [Lactarius quietus]|nr:X-domain of DnaJ-containing-domain-containing protein [Lactarius quietus]
MLTIRCCSCKQTFSHAFYPTQVPSGMLGTGGKGRKIGTQERPLETGYYDLLGVPIDATQTILRRHTVQIQRFGSKESAPEGGFVDPEEVFGAIFGGERFLPLIGQLSLARDMKSALQEADEATGEGAAVVARDAKGREIISPEERRREMRRPQDGGRAAAREERVQKLVDSLQHKLGIFTENASGPTDAEVMESWRTICSLEAKLKGESYGVELLHAIGFAYTAKAKQFLASNQSFLGVADGYITCRGNITSFPRRAVSTLRSAIELKAVFDQIQQAEQSGTLSPEEKKRLEEQAAEKGLQALLRYGAKLEIDSVIRETCDRVLNDPTISRDKAVMRAVALQILGNAFAAVRNDREEAREEGEYVRIETKSSRQRAQSRATSGQ